MIESSVMGFLVMYILVMSFVKIDISVMCYFGCLLSGIGDATFGCILVVSNVHPISARCWLVHTS